MRTIRDTITHLLKDKDFENPKSLEDLGYIFFGPLVFNYFFWLKDEIKDGDLILFNSREGYFLNQIYQLFKEKYNLPKSVYFKTSRKLASLSSYVSEEDIYESFNLHRYEGNLSELLKDRFGLNNHTVTDIKIDTLNKLPNLNQCILDILGKSHVLRNEYRKYIDATIGNSKNVYMIDSGFQGTTQYYLQKTFNLDLKGRYMTYKGNIDLKNTKGFYDFEKCSFKDNIIFFESVFTDKVGTFIDLIGNEFINEDNTEIEKYFEDKTKIVNGIKEFVQDMLFFNIIDSEIPQQFADELFNLMCIDGYIKNELLFESFLHENRYVKNNVKKINKKNENNIRKYKFCI
jgi:hypothetical protein